ncbi:Crp/Fnr family transcriptional regulator [Flagellimonas sp. S174]|uniref:Crp/Fnr family transcriptional regulator n=1 Tax=Flagellimonas sp. S174 TaxID=3410790 RepID=UPI003BF5EE5B
MNSVLKMVDDITLNINFMQRNDGINFKARTYVPYPMIRTNIELKEYIIDVTKDKNSDFVRIGYTASDKVIEQGSRVKNIYIMIEGLIKCFLIEESGKEFVQEFFGTGELFGELEIVNGSTSLCAVEAITDIEVFKIKHEKFLKLIEKDKKLNRLYINALTSKIYYKGTRHSYNQLHTLEEKLSSLSQFDENARSKIHKQDLASYFGVSIRSLNRALRKLNG